MLKKIVALFQSKQAKPETEVTKVIKPNKPKVEPARIGELGEYKINIQLDQLPKKCQHLNAQNR
ncbi:hypothetical protein [Paenibacillus sp. GXUN7292]|uniref:hypothetical protein n=1 Tax=Paenibacillus sp. GXUN7292 TaxID=3422499 RepID=UPI003D7D706B